jgi:hypothetical protein
MTHFLQQWDVLARLFGAERYLSLFIPVTQLSMLTKVFRLFIPVEEAYMQHIYVIDKKEDGTVTRKKEYGVQYVPLTDAPKDEEPRILKGSKS